MVTRISYIFHYFKSEKKKICQSSFNFYSPAAAAFTVSSSSSLLLIVVIHH